MVTKHNMYRVFFQIRSDKIIICPLNNKFQRVKYGHTAMATSPQETNSLFRKKISIIPTTSLQTFPAEHGPYNDTMICKYWTFLLPNY